MCKYKFLYDNLNNRSGEQIFNNHATPNVKCQMLEMVDIMK